MSKSCEKNTYTVVLFEKEPEKIKRFLRFFPKAAKRNNNFREEKHLLMGTHPLTPYFQIQPFFLYKNGEIIGKAALFFEKTPSKHCFLGFFEMENDTKGAEVFFKKMEKFAQEKGVSSIVGPMNGCIWLGYRMKISHFFEKTYFGEPDNPPYYSLLWIENGYRESNVYTSNIYPVFEKNGYRNPRFEKRIQSFVSQGYDFHVPKKKEWETVAGDIYELIMSLYASFPGFLAISKEAFFKQYSALKMILNFSFCRMVYFDKKAVGFFIAVPDYGTLLNGSLTPWVLLKMLYLRRFSRKYVVFYMGAEPEHKGLGAAMAQILIESLRKKKASAVSALIHEGKVTGGYAKDFSREQRKYALYQKTL